MPFFAHDGIQFHYRDTHPGENAGLTPFFFQHGLGADTAQIFELFQPPAGFRLLSFDSRAHGETRPVGPEENINIAQFADDWRAFLDHLHIERAIIGGISMGAATALHFALTQPARVRGLVLSRPAWLDRSRGEEMRVFTTLAKFIREYGATIGAQKYQESAAYQQVLQLAPENAAALLGQFGHPRAEETVAKLERIPAHIPAHSRADWKKIMVPTLVLANRRDAVHPFEFGQVLAREISGAAFVEIAPKSDGLARHAAEVQRAVEEFLVKNFSNQPAAV